MLRVRCAEPDDGEELARLAAQLGYAHFAHGNFLRLVGRDDGDETLLVARSAEAAPGKLLGWIHLRHWRTILIGDLVDIGGLVVDERHHGRGVGRALVAASAAWGRARGIALLQARSGSQRTAAHGFYRHLGFALNKQQQVFHLALGQQQVAWP
jgi:GNAT superfamily N-acetyltransferase